MDREENIVYDEGILGRLRNYLDNLGNRMMIKCGDLEWTGSELRKEVDDRTPTGLSAYAIWVKFGERGL